MDTMPPPTSDRKPSVEQLKFGFATVISIVFAICGFGTSIFTLGTAWQRLSVLENSADQGDRIRVERGQQLDSLQREIDVLKERIQTIKEGRIVDSEKLDSMDEKLGKITELLVAMCQAQRVRGVTCTVR